MMLFEQRLLSTEPITPKRRKRWHSVVLRIYDLSCGKAARWSPLLFGKKFKGVWHTGLVVYGFEYFYGDGVMKMPPDEAEEHVGMDLRYEVPLGRTHKSRGEFEKYLIRLENLFTPETYNVFNWNCNHFSNACVFELLGVELPYFILAQDKVIARCRNGPLVLRIAKALSHGSVDSGSRARQA